MREFQKILLSVELANRRNSLFKKGGRLLLAVSGGPDSMALLYVFSKLQRKYALSIVVAHVNHGLLKRQSAEAEALVKKTAQGMGYSFYSKKINLKLLAKKSGRSLEETGRVERYRFFRDLAKKTRSSQIVTAHTLDDQAETMLMRIFRGSGLRGLAGIPYKRKEDIYEVIRPFLALEKKDILLFLKKARIPYCLDKTNKSLMFTRNRLRHKLLPEIEKSYNPQIRQSLQSLQAVCVEVQNYLDVQTVRLFRLACIHAIKSRSKKIALRIAPLRKLPTALLNEVLLRALTATRGDLKKLGYVHLEAMGDILRSPEQDLELHLPGGARVRKKKDVLEITAIH